MLRHSNESAQDNSSLILSRTALDSIGRLGSLYDACQDQVLGVLEITHAQPPLIEYHEKTKCTLTKGDQNVRRNLLEIINIDEQLRLSVLLNLTSNTGLATIIDYPNIINEYTRILHYTYIHRAERFSDEVQKIREGIHVNPTETTATHIITGVSWGIDIVVVLQLPEDDSIVTNIDDTLDKYCAYLNEDSNDFRLTRDDINAQKNIFDTKIYSNIASVMSLPSLHAVFHTISRLKLDETEHRQLSYILYSIPNTNYISLEANQFEEHLYELSTSMKIMKACFNQDMPTLLCGHFKERFSNAYKPWSDLKIEFTNYIKQYAKLVTDTRYGQTQISTLNQMLGDRIHKTLKNNILSLCKDVMDLNRKGHLINDLGRQNIQYCNAAERHIDRNDDINSIQRKLMIDEKTDRILCSSDKLNKQYPKKFKSLGNDLLDELQTNSKRRLIYADFSYAAYELQDMIIIPLVKSEKKKKKSKNKEISASASTLTEISSSTTPSLANNHRTMQTTSSNISFTETINILLVGDTGVGKTTFINAFVNYLTFQTLDQAQSNTIIIPIPVSFPIDMRHDTRDYVVEAGDLTREGNENFQHPGQSTTQRCKSYVYNLHNRAGTKLRFIDTPGFGDARGSDHDNLNMQHIVEYMKKVKYLNALCVFLKPNEEMSSTFIRSYFNQLINALDSDIRNNIIFCFTNSRSILYSPGRITPLIKNQLSSLSMDDILFMKKNIFYFDNETFRYLVALANRIEFTDNERENFEMSWLKSSAETKRFIRYLRKRLPLCYIRDESDRIRSFEIEIVQMIHPILETIRNIFRKIILAKMIQLKNSSESDSNDDIDIDNDHHSCKLPVRRPLPIEFLGDYKTDTNGSNQRQDNLINQLLLLCHVNIEFSYFLLYVAQYSHGDPFLDGFLRMINEENIICENRNQDYMNLQLVDGLKKLASNYKQRMELAKSKSKQNSLQNIQNWIKYMHECKWISEYVIQNLQQNTSDEVKVTSI